MKPILKIFTFTKHLWPYYAAVSFFSILIALMAQATPIATGVLIGELQNLVTDTEVNKTLVWAMVAVIAVKDLAETITFYGYIYIYNVYRIFAVEPSAGLLQHNTEMKSGR
ncbi:MAG: hypothetical protein AAF413_03860 [Patescibacteria group bacterium]